jgi:hypothetical protein
MPTGLAIHQDKVMVEVIGSLEPFLVFQRKIMF